MTEAEEAVMRAEVVALQAVMISLFRHMASEHPQLATTFCRAFDHAEAIVTGVAVKMGLDAPRETTVGALQVIDELRAAVIRDESICKPEE
jgi:hypothetical protein